jgi:hypothetical protein
MAASIGGPLSYHVNLAMSLIGTFDTCRDVQTEFRVARDTVAKVAL